MSQALIDAFNAATTWEQALAAIKNEEFSAILFDGPTGADYIGKLEDLPDNAGREQAIGLGILEIKSLFGSFTSVENIKAEVKLQIEVEYAKHEFITALDGATTDEGMAAAIKATVLLVHQQRQALIAKWDAIDGNAALDARVAALKADPYTNALAEIVKHLDDEVYMADLGARVKDIRDGLEGGKFFGVVKIANALIAADEAIDDAMVAEFNAADTWQEALAAIKGHPSTLLDADHLAKLDDLPDGQGREQAIGLGIVQFKALFGDFASVDSIRDAVKSQIDTEHAKFEFITALDDATTAAEMAAAIKDTVELVNQHRQELITYLLSDPMNADAVQLAGVLQQASYTTVLAEIVTHLDDAGYMAELGARMLTARNALEGSQFFGDSRIIPALAAADEAIDAVVTAFNEADTWQEALAAIKDNASVLLDAGHLDKLDQLPDNQGRETAIGLGVIEIKTLFGNFTSLDTIITEVRYQIDVEHAKFAALNAINSATAETMVDVLKEHLGNLNDHRQELIEKWSVSSDEDARDRAAQLSEDTYTVVLAEIVSHFDDATYMAKLAEIMLGADDFFSINLLIGALRAADIQLDTPVADAEQSVTTNEDTVIVQDIGATDPNGDTLQYSVKETAQPQKGTVTFADGKFTYTRLTT